AQPGLATTAWDPNPGPSTRPPGTAESIQTPPWWRRWPPPRRIILTAGALVTLAVAGVIWLSLGRDLADVEPPQFTIDPLTQQLRRGEPCNLVDTAALKQFGRPDLVPGPYLNTCEVAIDIPSGDVDLRIAFDDPKPVSDFDGPREQRGNVFLFPQGLEGDNCQDRLVLAEDQPVIYVASYNYNRYPGDLCAITRVATEAALAKLQQNGGITYSPNRLAAYSHAGADACVLLDQTILSKIAGFNPNGLSPIELHWQCDWEDDSNGNAISLTLGLENSGTIDYYGRTMERWDLDGKTVFISRPGPQECDAILLHRSTSTATETLIMEVEAPLATEEPCALARELVTAADKRLPL
ncbi:MAG: hypothetical protein M3332_11955, partial [Actinomycetota bacterium]|nr:hypothetical protein [Actinomycetota bacterium]